MGPDNYVSKNRDQWGELPLMVNEQVIEVNPDQSQLTKRYTQKATEFIEQHQHQPFFIYIAHSMPHVPIFASSQFKGKSAQGLYGDVVEEIDWSIGEIVKKIKELNLLQNTLIIFSSDNGPAIDWGNYGGSAFPLRNGKGTNFEGGVRVPFIAHWPVVIKPAVREDVATIMDILPTFSDIVQLDSNSTPNDGQSLMPLFRGDEIKPKPYFYYNSSDLVGVRSGNWKLLLPHKVKRIKQLNNDGTRSVMENFELELSLFNLYDDPAETTNLVHLYPDKVEELKYLIDDFVDYVNKNKRPPGIAFE